MSTGRPARGWGGTPATPARDATGREAGRRGGLGAAASASASVPIGRAGAPEPRAPPRPAARGRTLGRGAGRSRRDGRRGGDGGEGRVVRAPSAGTASAGMDPNPFAPRCGTSPRRRRWRLSALTRVLAACRRPRCGWRSRRAPRSRRPSSRRDAACSAARAGAGAPSRRAREGEGCVGAWDGGTAESRRPPRSGGRRALPLARVARLLQAGDAEEAEVDLEAPVLALAQDLHVHGVVADRPAERDAALLRSPRSACRTGPALALGRARAVVARAEAGTARARAATEAATTLLRCMCVSLLVWCVPRGPRFPRMARTGVCGRAGPARVLRAA